MILEFKILEIICSIKLLTHHGKGRCPFLEVPLTQGCFIAKFDRNWSCGINTKNYVMIFNISLDKKDVVLCFDKVEYRSPKSELCQSWLKLVPEKKLKI